MRQMILTGLIGTQTFITFSIPLDSDLLDGDPGLDDDGVTKGEVDPDPARDDDGVTKGDDPGLEDVGGTQGDVDLEPQGVETALSMNRERKKTLIINNI